MDCEKFDQHVIDELYDELDELTHAALERHVAGCSRCAGVLAGLRATREIGVLPLEEPSADLEARILEAVAVAVPAPSPRGKVIRGIAWVGRHALRPQLAMAAVLCLVVGSGLFLARGSRKSPAAVAAAAPAPAALARAAGAGKATVTAPPAPAATVEASAAPTEIAAAPAHAADAGVGAPQLIAAAPASCPRSQARRSASARRRGCARRRGGQARRARCDGRREGPRHRRGQPARERGPLEGPVQERLRALTLGGRTARPSRDLSRSATRGAPRARAAIAPARACARRGRGRSRCRCRGRRRGRCPPRRGRRR